MEPEAKQETTAAAVAPASSSQANLSDLVKEIVKEMDGDDFYEKADVYDESAEVGGRVWAAHTCLYCIIGLYCR